MRLMWLPYFREDCWVGCIQFATEGRVLVATDVRPESGPSLEIEAVVFGPGREQAAAQTLLEHLTYWLTRFDLAWWPEFDTECVARAMAAMIQDSS